MHYHWSHAASLVQDVEIYAPHKKEEAVLYAASDAEPSRLQHLADALRSRGYTAQADTQGIYPVLRVGNFPSKEALLGALKTEGALTGEPEISKSALDAKKGHGFSTLQIGGAMQVLADMMVMSVALSRGKEGMGDFLASAKWAWAYVMVSAFGKKNPDKQLGYIYKDLKDQLDHSGLQMVPEDVATLAALAEKSGVMPKVERMVRENPILINSLIQMSGGASTIQAGTAQKDYNGNKNWWKIAGGSLTASGQLVGGILLDPKQTHTDANGNAIPDWAENREASNSIAQRAADWVKEKPLRVTGAASFLSNVTRIVSGLVEKKKYTAYMGDTQNNFAGGEYAARRDALFADAKAQGAELSKEGVSLKDMFTRTEQSVLDKQGMTREAKQAAKKAAQEASQHPHALLEARRDELLDTFNRVSRTKQAATVDFIANGIKMAANVMIASSSSNIDADLTKTGQLDEVCNFLAHVVQAQPEEKREVTLHAAAAMLSSKKGVAATEPELTQRIRNKLEALQHNPWQKGSTSPAAAPEKEAEPGSQLQYVASHEAMQPATVQEARL